MSPTSGANAKRLRVSTAILIRPPGRSWWMPPENMSSQDSSTHTRTFTSRSWAPTRRMTMKPEPRQRWSAEPRRFSTCAVHHAPWSPPKDTRRGRPKLPGGRRVIIRSTWASPNSTAAPARSFAKSCPRASSRSRSSSLTRERLGSTMRSYFRLSGSRGNLAW